MSRFQPRLGFNSEDLPPNDFEKISCFLLVPKITTPGKDDRPGKILSRFSDNNNSRRAAQRVFQEDDDMSHHSPLETVEEDEPARGTRTGRGESKTEQASTDRNRNDKTSESADNAGRNPTEDEEESGKRRTSLKSHSKHSSKVRMKVEPEEDQEPAPHSQDRSRGVSFDEETRHTHPHSGHREETYSGGRSRRQHGHRYEHEYSQRFHAYPGDDRREPYYIESGRYPPGPPMSFHGGYPEHGYYPRYEDPGYFMPGQPVSRGFYSRPQFYPEMVMEYPPSRMNVPPEHHYIQQAPHPRIPQPHYIQQAHREAKPAPIQEPKPSVSRKTRNESPQRIDSYKFAEGGSEKKSNLAWEKDVVKENTETSGNRRASFAYSEDKSPNQSKNTMDNTSNGSGSKHAATVGATVVPVVDTLYTQISLQDAGIPNKSGVSITPVKLSPMTQQNRKSIPGFGPIPFVDGYRAPPVITHHTHPNGPLTYHPQFQQGSPAQHGLFMSHGTPRPMQQGFPTPQLLQSPQTVRMGFAHPPPEQPQRPQPVLLQPQHYQQVTHQPAMILPRPPAVQYRDPGPNQLPPKVYQVAGPRTVVYGPQIQRQTAPCIPNAPPPGPFPPPDQQFSSSQPQHRSRPRKQQ